MKTQLNSINQNLVVWSNRALKAIGLWAVAMIVIAVCTTKLDGLRHQQSQLPTDYITAAQRTQELECLTRNIYWEAASEPFEGKVAVAQVTLNRMESKKFPSTVCGVVQQKNVIYDKVICQFSWMCEGSYKTKPVYYPLWKESEEVAKKVLLEGFRLPSLKKALFYHADYVSPGWKLPRIEKIGRHIFYGES